MSAAAISSNDFFGAARPVHAWAPGRVNLLGEHTDYNDRYMLPVATPQRTDVLAAPSDDGQLHVYSATLDQAFGWSPGDASPAGFALHIDGCIRLLGQRGHAVSPLKPGAAQGSRRDMRGAVPHRHGGCRGTARRNESQRRRRRRDAAHSRIHPVTTL